MFNPLHVRLALGAGVVGILGFVTLSFLYTKQRRLVGTVKKLIIYPIKACCGMEVEEALCTPHGLASTDGLLRDRQLMLVNGEGVCVTGREHPTLVKFVTYLEGSDLVLAAPDVVRHRINLEAIKRSSKLVPCDVFGQKFLAVECDEESHAWFSAYLDAPVRLLYFNADICTRQVQDLEVGVHHRINRPNKEYSQTMFPDEFPYLAVNQQSCEDLNTSLDSSSQISYRNFRPNILITTKEAWIEDHWRCVTVGNQQFYNEKPCGRCRNVNVNPDTAVLYPKAEPLNTLRKRRMLISIKAAHRCLGWTSFSKGSHQSSK